jgi:hypothetical protein
MIIIAIAVAIVIAIIIKRILTSVKQPPKRKNHLKLVKKEDE